MRLYQQLWIIIRDANGATVKISCPQHLRARIRKAIYKERNMDASVGRQRRLQITLTSTGILFRLRGRRVCTGIEIIPDSAATIFYNLEIPNDSANESDSGETS